MLHIHMYTYIHIYICVCICVQVKIHHIAYTCIGENRSNKSYHYGRIQKDPSGSLSHVEYVNVTDVIIGIKDFRVCFPSSIEAVRPKALIISLFQLKRNPNSMMIIALRGFVSAHVLVDHLWNYIGKTGTLSIFLRTEPKEESEGRGRKDKEEINRELIERGWKNVE